MCLHHICSAPQLHTSPSDQLQYLSSPSSTHHITNPSSLSSFQFISSCYSFKNIPLISLACYLSYWCHTGVWRETYFHSSNNWNKVGGQKIRKRSKKNEKKKDAAGTEEERESKTKTERQRLLRRTDRAVERGA